MEPHDTTDRRGFLVRLGALGAAAWVAPRPGWAAVSGSSRRPVLVTVFLRGGADALNLVVPHEEPAYYQSRPTIAVPPPGRSEGALPLDARFGLHPAMEPLHAWYRGGRLAVVHAVGRPGATRSHFEEQDVWETADLHNDPGTAGWINRYLQSTRGEGPVRAVCFGGRLVRALRGPAPAQAVRDLGELDLKAHRLPRRRLKRLLERLHAGEGDPVCDAGRAALDAVAELGALDTAGYRPAAGAAYPDSRLGRGLAQAAQLIKAELGVEVVACERGGWDTHQNQGGVEGAQARRAGDLAAALTAFAQDLGPRLDRVLVLVMSEFGRTLRENGSKGTDHGRGGALWLLGGRTRGGAVHGSWPGLSKDSLHRGRELAVGTDFRDVLLEVLGRHLGHPDPLALLRGHKPRPLEVLEP